jgi:hypothetical protein
MPKGFVVALALVLWTALAIMPARAEEDIRSANYLLPHCTPVGTPVSDYYLAGKCDGVVDAAIGMMQMNREVCLPNGVTGGQAKRVVTRYADLTPR